MISEYCLVDLPNHNDQPSITASISLQMVSSSLKGPQATDGLISATE